jgi:hypothetical protein
VDSKSGDDLELAVFVGFDARKRPVRPVNTVVLPVHFFYMQQIKIFSWSVLVSFAEI